MATTKAREDIKNDLKTLKEDLKVGAREETARLREKAGVAEARIREKAAETGAHDGHATSGFGKGFLVHGHLEIMSAAMRPDW